MINSLLLVCLFANHRVFTHRQKCSVVRFCNTGIQAAVIQQMASPTEGSAFPAWARSVKEVEKHFKVDTATGLSEDDIVAKRAIYGRNELSKAPPTPLWKLILEQVRVY